MNYRERKPVGRLANVIKQYWSLEYDGADAEPETVLPDGCPEIVFSLGDRFQRIHANGSYETQASAIASGQLRQHILIRPTGAVRLFGVRFRPYGAWAFFDQPMSELTGNVVALDSVIGSRANDLAEMIAGSRSFEGQISAFESALFPRTCDERDGQKLATHISDRIVSNGGRVSVSKLRDAYGLSERRLERIFRRAVGLSPKMFSRIVRFQNVVRQIETAESPDLLDTGLEFGYYDQSHMIREFKEFSGKSPRAYFEETHRISELFTAGLS